LIYLNPYFLDTRPLPALLFRVVFQAPEQPDVEQSRGEGLYQGYFQVGF
jgi:hypothetical protein